jgi:cellulose synthase/poly-beta-1,6-N-acetylglucosamine synthase-like glycosyltransferase
VSVVLFVIAALFWLLLLYYSVLCVAGLAFRSRLAPSPSLGEYPGVAILIAAYNEEKVLAETLDAMARLRYDGPLTVYVLNDNSTDATGDIADYYASMFSHIRHVKVPPGTPKGKGRVLNYGLTLVREKYVAVYDADNQPEPDALRLLVEAAVQTRGAVGAVGYVKTLNAKKNWLTRMIALEFAVFQLLMQCGRWHLFGLGTLTGTNLVVEREALVSAGGWDSSALAEDADLSITLAALGGRLPIVPQSRSWEQEPQTFAVWLRQRTRWMQGNLQLIRKMLKTPSWRERHVFLHAAHILSIYIVFAAVLFISDVWFLFGVLGVANTSYAAPLLLLWFESWLIYVIQLLSAEVADDLASPVNLAVSFVMYFTYSQLWLFLLVRAAFFEYKRQRMKVEPVWDKTVRF